MITLDKWKSGQHKTWIKAVHVGMPGEGKTHLAATYPKNVFALTTKGEEDTFLYKDILRKNVVGWEYFCADGAVTPAVAVKNLQKFVKDEVRPMISKGEVETFTLDNLTHLAETWWEKICVGDKHLYTSKGGEFDTRSAYGALKDELKCFIRDEVVSLDCNVVINVHLKLEDEAVMDKKPDKTVTYSPMVLGGFRDLLAGLVSYVFYLEKVSVGGQYKYRVRTNKSNGMAAKSRIELPTVIEDVTYSKIKQVIDQQKGQL